MKFLSGPCWIEEGRYHDPNGYRPTIVNGKKRYAHQIAYEVLIGPIPKGLEPDHLCRNKPCFNPAHLELVTRSENTRRGLVYRNGVCRKCGEELNDVTAYRVIEPACVDGFVYDCKRCRREQHNNWYRLNRSITSRKKETVE